MAGRYRSGSEKRKFVRKLSIAAVLLVAVCMAAVAVPAAVKYVPAVQEEPVTPMTEDPNLVWFGDEAYIPKQNIETYLFMGIDDSGTVRKREEYDGTGQCDAIMLLVRDKSAGTFQILPLDRNTMMDVKCIDYDGTYLATVENQLALAHADGDGLEMSCENVVDAVSNFFDGQQIDGYAAVNMGCIGIINQLIGGVTVTIEDDFSEMDETLKIGETVTLNNEQAVSYVRGRMLVGDGKNEGRLRRQSEYMKQAEVRFREKCGEDSSFPLQAYEAVQEYMVTNISKQKFSKIALLIAKDKNAGELKLEGETVIGEMDFEEFRPTRESKEQVMAQLFYEKYE